MLSVGDFFQYGVRGVCFECHFKYNKSNQIVTIFVETDKDQQLKRILFSPLNSGLLHLCGGSKLFQFQLLVYVLYSVHSNKNRKFSNKSNKSENE